MLKHRLDAHFHLQTVLLDYCSVDTLGKNIIRSFLKKDSKSICNSTSPMDWNLVLDLFKLFPNEIVPFYGIHPWYVENLPENWFDRLNSYLIKSGSGVGEIGLDRTSSFKASFNKQLDIFKTQLDLAVSMNRPVSIHCVRAWGIILDILKEKILTNSDGTIKCKIPVMIHSFSGSMDIMKILTDMGVFLSFSPYLLSVKAGNLRNIFKFVPLERILIESDFLYKGNIPINTQIYNYNRNLTSLYKIAGLLRNIDSEYFREVVNSNGKIFTNRTSDWKKKYGNSSF